MVAAAALSLATVWGTAYVFPLLFPALEASFGLSRAAASWIFSIGVAASLGLAPWAGSMSARFGVRRALAIAAFAIGTGFVVFAMAPVAVVALAGYALAVGIGGSLAYVPAVSAVTPWFERRRGLATGLASIGTGLGTIVFPALFTAVLAASDWRIAIGVVGLVGATALALVAWLIDDRPARRGWAADGVRLDAAAAAAIADDPPRRAPLAWRDAMQAPDVRGLWMACGLYTAAMFVTFAHLVAAARDAGIDAPRAGALLAMIGVGNVAGRALFGVLSDRGPRVTWLAATMAVMGATPLAWPLASGFTSFVAIALVFGAAYGGAVALYPAATADLLGARFDARVLGIVYSGCVPSALFAPVLAGWSFDRFGSYTPVAIATALLAMVGARIVLRLAPADTTVSSGAARARGA